MFEQMVNKIIEKEKAFEKFKFKQMVDYQFC
jgi:hypothetical protein